MRTKEEIFEDFQSYFSKKGFELEEINLKVIPYFENTAQDIEFEIKDIKNEKMFDCATSRTVTSNGIWACPMLIGDYRAKLGTTLDDYSKLNYLDCEKCATCANWQNKVMVNDWC